MNNSSILSISLTVVLFTLLFDLLTNAAIIKRSSQINKIGDPNKRHVDKEKLKIYRIITEHIGPSVPSVEASNDSSKYDAIEFEEKKIAAVQEVVTSFPDAKNSRSIDESANLRHLNEKNIPFLNNSNTNNGMLITGIEGNSYQTKKSLNVLEISRQNQFNGLNPQAMNDENYGRYKLPYTSLSNKHPLESPGSKVFYANSDLEDDDELGSDYDAADVDVQRDVKTFQRKPNQMYISTQVYKKEFIKSYVPIEMYKEYYSQNYKPTEVYKGYYSQNNGPTKIYNQRDNQGHVSQIITKERDSTKHNLVHDYDEENINHALSSRTYENSLSDHKLKTNDDVYGTFKRLISTSQPTTSKSFLNSEKVGNNSHVHVINNTIGETIVEEGPLKTDEKTTSTEKVNRFQPGQGSNVNSKIERKSLVDNVDIDAELSQPLLKFYDNIFPWKLNNRSGDINLDIVEKPFKKAENGNAVFYFGDETKRPEKRDLGVSFMQILKDNVFAAALIIILSIVVVFLLLHAIFIVSRRTEGGNYTRLGGDEQPRCELKCQNTCKSCFAPLFFFLELFVAGCMKSNPFENKSSRQNVDSESSKVPGKERLKKLHDVVGSELEDSDDKINDSQEHIPTTANNGFHYDLEVTNLEDSTYNDPLWDILNSKIKRSRNSGHDLEDCDADFKPPIRQKRHNSRRYRKKSRSKKSNLPPPDLESILSHECDQSTDTDSPELNWKPDPENLRMKIMTTGEIKEIDEMLVGRDWNRRVYGKHPLRAIGAKGVTFSVREDTMAETCKNGSSGSATTKESTRSLEKELGESLHQAEHVHNRGKPLSKKEFDMKQY